ncbi:MAG: dTDP-4-dehydrorhamnose 3,5-epimerase, partial [Cyanobacteria bacterium]|nr:dTDP-4-dehydrorhamnose 3,5-epimerase [Cyanobacteriota bacterium]
MKQKFSILPTRLEGSQLMVPTVYEDTRGYFLELYHQKDFHGVGIEDSFVQTNLSRSQKNVLRGLHFQHPPYGMSKLVYCPEGEVFDVMVDLRKQSPTFGQWEGFILSEENKRILYIPEGFAHGFCVLSETALLLYQCNQVYNAQADAGILWNDPDLNIDWPLLSQGIEPLLSPKDKVLPPFQQSQLY